MNKIEQAPCAAADGGSPLQRLREVPLEGAQERDGRTELARQATHGPPDSAPWGCRQRDRFRPPSIGHGERSRLQLLKMTRTNR